MFYTLDDDCTLESENPTPGTHPLRERDAYAM